MRAGVLFGIGAYGLWGLFPLYFHLLDDVAPMEVLANRVVWSLFAVLAVLGATRRVDDLRRVAADRRSLALLSGCGVLIAINWGTYIYAVSSGHVIEGALGYFITPLISVGLGMTFFGERLRRGQIVALTLGTLAVLVLTAAAGRFPWIALILATSFGTYGLLKKLAGAGAAEGLALETMVVFVPALAVLLWFAVGGGDGSLTGGDASTTLLLMAAGPVTAVPLLLFAACVTRVPLSMIGLLQYMTPVLQFAIGWLALSEPMTTERWIGFGLVWIALSVLTWDGLRHAGDPAADELEAEFA